MAKASNLLGQRFGKLTVVERAENNHKGNTMWKCQCDCGETKIALGYDLTHGRTVSCGCNLVGKPSPNRKDLTGMKFGRLTALNVNDKKSGKGIVYWDCICECGCMTSVRAGNLLMGNVRSCGCLAIDSIKKITHKALVTDKVGKRYNNYVVLERLQSEDDKTYWKCKCDCGNEFIVENRQLYRKKSCGCLNGHRGNDLNSDIAFFVGSGMIEKNVYSRLRQEWHSMLRRCREDYHQADVYYYRGIKVYDEWQNFRTFALWALANGYQNDLTLDRVDNFKGYSPDNCRWTTWKAQENNKRNNVNITYMGKTQTLKQWSEELNLTYGMLKQRYRKGIVPPMLFEPNSRKPM